MNQINVELYNPVQATTMWHEAYERIIKPGTMAGQEYRLIVKPATRKLTQNAKFHAMIADIAKQIGGDLADADDAKRILLSAYRIDTMHMPEFADEWRAFGEMRIGRGLRSETVMLGQQTRDLSVKLASGFVEWLEAFGAENGVRFSAPQSLRGAEKWD